MKKLVVMLMSALLLLSFLSVTGCQKKAEQPAETAAPVSNAPAAPAANAPAAPAANAPAGQ
ncbi:MAG: hypothetical protein M0Z75_17410 [Nitrospiraceae bacterium]|nr:hypothetical protein [Nitrospiraceae bacterium]